MPAAQIFRLAKCFEDSTAYILARIRGTSGSLVTQGSLSAINLRVYDVASPPETSDQSDPEVIAARDLTISSVVFDTLQTDSGWDTEQDASGFNLKIEVLPADLPRGGVVYRFEVKFTNSSSKIWHAAFDVPSEGLYRS